MTHPLHNTLHNAEVIHNGHEGSEEDDSRKHLEGKEEPETSLLSGRYSQRSEYELCSVQRESKESNEALADRIKDLPPDVCLEHKESENELHPKTDADKPPADCPFVGREKESDTRDDDESQKPASDR